ncbi:antibiotic biosynthesis monooxygenase [Actinosynnema sp. ALI-1.44]|uniref:antibiotic biosynthesis monooxygenase family protein n=1 Tax=Actinosynnema sp. ALI-1.44 TaxID=1933779 RepID=UPI00097C6D92|nr:antibiotic biosynthesis monooxygenase family protein [Actinosynnema sp. ALI-1.44]ONI76388.1 antibiotic biosynthesis monooxygenase [Actinosynnema sp. ALI-1.44]
MVVFVNRLVLTGSAAELEQRYAKVADFMRAQDGIIRYRLLRSRKDPSVYFNVAEWTDQERFDRALKDPRFRSLLAPVLEVVTGEPYVTDVVLAGEAVQVG